MENIYNTQVSIVMPTFNRSEKLALAIKSILKQTYQDWELLIIDNGSTDNTRNAAEAFSKVDGRVKYFNVEKSRSQGLSEYLNYGIKIAKGEYIARLDDDDEWYEIDKLKKQVNFLNQNKEYVLVGGGAIMVDGQKKELYRFFKREKDAEIRNNALYACPFWHNTVLFRRKEALEVGGYKDIRFGEDWDLWLKLGKIGKFYNFKEYFSLYLNDNQNFSVNAQKYVGKTILKIIKEYRNDYSNYRKAFLLNFMQYLFSFTPLFIKKRIQNFLFYIKRNYF